MYINIDEIFQSLQEGKPITDIAEEISQGLNAAQAKYNNYKISQETKIKNIQEWAAITTKLLGSYYPNFTHMFEDKTKVIDNLESINNSIKQLDECGEVISRWLAEQGL